MSRVGRVTRRQNKLTDTFLMRHLKSGRHLNRTSSHRKRMFANMCISLIEHEEIKTTVIKAKELRRFIEPLITLARTDTVANRRQAFAYLRSKSAVGKLFQELGPRFESRPGGYTRILKSGFRKGDSAMVCYMSFVDDADATDVTTTDEDFEAVEDVQESEDIADSEPVEDQNTSIEAEEVTEAAETDETTPQESEGR